MVFGNESGRTAPARGDEQDPDDDSEWEDIMAKRAQRARELEDARKFSCHVV